MKNYSFYLLHKNHSAGIGLIFFFLFLLPCKGWSGNWIDVADISGYTGHESDTRFTITTPEQLSGLAQLVNTGKNFAGKTVLRDTDIHLSNKLWTPIGYNLDYQPRNMF